MDRKGTLWEDRFKSVLVEGEGDPLMTMAAYIDLNPVRAGMVSDPRKYRWSGYGEAMAGRQRAKEGIRRIYGLGVRSLEVTISGGFAPPDRRDTREDSRTTLLAGLRPQWVGTSDFQIFDPLEFRKVRSLF